MPPISPEEPYQKKREQGILARWALPLSLLFSLIVALIVERRVFSDPYAINDDVRNQIYWMAQIMQPSLFDHDYIAAYFTQPMLVSPALYAVYRFAGAWVTPLTLS